MRKSLVLICTILMMLNMNGCTFSAAQENGETAQDDDVQTDETYAPKVTILENGVKIQKTPADVAESTNETYWNNYYLNADNRGCTACHTLEDALEDMETYHGTIYFGYDVEQGLQNCFGCHSFYDSDLGEAIHTLHQNNAKFIEIGGSCESCHYIEKDDDGTSAYERWDYVKYDILRGFEYIAADDVDMVFEWNQTEVTAREDMYYKSMKSDPDEWILTDDDTSEDVFNNWEISFTGAIDNEVSMTLKELIEKYGTQTRLMKNHCNVNGPGQGMIYQAEVEGICLTDIMKDLGVHEDAIICNPIATDGYSYPIATELLETEEALLVVGMNGDRIYAEQGWPVAIWFNELSAGNFVKQVTEINFATEGTSSDFYGNLIDATTAQQFDKPNVGVLTAYDGQVFEEDIVHIEGYADAWNEPIIRLEFSLDKGSTWKEYDIEDANTTQWVYWKADFNNLSVGSYLLKIRVSSRMADGTIRTNDADYQMTNFMFNVQ